MLTSEFVGRMLDQGFVARLQRGGQCQMVRHRRSGGRCHAIGGDAVARRQSLHQWSVAVQCGTVDLQVLELYRQLGQGITHDPAGRQVVRGGRAQLGKLHVGRAGVCTRWHQIFSFSLLFLAAQKAYTGRPSSRIEHSEQTVPGYL